MKDTVRTLKSLKFEEAKVEFDLIGEADKAFKTKQL